MSDRQPVSLPVWQSGQPGADTHVVPVDIEGPVLSEESRGLA
jgi:hypothetical protein